MIIIRKPIDIISHGDGKRYTSITKYEKALDQKGQYIMSDNEFKKMREQLRDESSSAPKPKENFNHIHIDFNNDTVTKSTRD